MSAQLNNLKANSGSSVYIHWGRKSCPIKDTVAVYSGVIGGDESGCSATTNAFRMNHCGILPTYIQSKLDNFTKPNMEQMGHRCILCRQNVGHSSFKFPPYSENKALTCAVCLT